MTTTTDEKKICCLCGREFKEWGNNAQPLSDGRCCNECNNSRVIPARINNIKKEMSPNLH